MIHQKLFGETVSVWLTQTVASTISDKALLMRGTVEAFAEIVRVRPELIQTIAEQYFPLINMLGIFKDGMVDVQLIQISLMKIFNRVQSIDLKEYIPRFSYNLTASEVESLCKALTGAEDASALLHKGETANV